MTAHEVLKRNHKRMHRNILPFGDICLIIILVSLGTLLWLESTDYPSSSRIYPRISLVIIGLGVLLLLAKIIGDVIRSSRETSSELAGAYNEGFSEEEGSPGEEEGSWRNAFLVSVTFGIYLIGAFNFDFYLSTVIFVMAMTLAMSSSRSLRVIFGALIFAAASTAIIYLVFATVLGVRLPSIIL